jgi:hypothetical protein
MFTGTPIALTALSDTHLLQLATLPQVLGVLAFVYAGRRATVPVAAALRGWQDTQQY